MLHILSLSILRHFHKIVQVAFNYIMSVSLSAWNNWAPTGQIFMKYDIRVYFFKIYLEYSSSVKIWQ
jgi:hypothetical protein